MVRHLELPRDASAPAAARRAVEEIAGLGDETVRDAKLLISELVANAVRHGDGERVRVMLDAGVPGRLRCEVVDDGHGFVPRATTPGEHGGWGLRLVEDMSRAWGVREGSTHVWFELATEARPG
jgi:anti-sigma regulatory factor (Ser/Thr protein kinase)